MYTDEQLMLLEQITYLNTEVKAAAKQSEKLCWESLFLLLQPFDDEHLKYLQSYGTIASSWMQGNEWAAVIRAIQADETLMELEIKQVWFHENGNVIAICFVHPQNPEQAIVSFRGTLDGDEWEDNVAGFDRADTKGQEEALLYVETLGYQDFILTGHSKGGNKAQYITIRKEQVSRCVSMDSQGFSIEFVKKYEKEIEAFARKITNYSLSSDYVHILLFQLKGATQRYCKGNGMKNGFENHSPNSFFSYQRDARGNSILRRNANGQVKVTIIAENPGLSYVQEFSYFLLNVMPSEQKQEIVFYLGHILALSMTHETVQIRGKEYSRDTFWNYVLSDQKALAVVMAYIMKYLELYQITMDQILALLHGFGFHDFANRLSSRSHKDGDLQHRLEQGQGVLRHLTNRWLQGKSGWISKIILLWISSWLEGRGHTEFSLNRFWSEVDAEYQKIVVPDVERAIQMPE